MLRSFIYNISLQEPFNGQTRIIAIKRTRVKATRPQTRTPANLFKRNRVVLEKGRRDDGRLVSKEVGAQLRLSAAMSCDAHAHTIYFQVFQDWASFTADLTVIF